MKKIFVALILLAVLCVSSFAAVPDKDIVILFTNDVHCGVDENIGYAGLMWYVREMKKATPYVALVDAGDWAQGATIGAISQGRYIFEIMNAMGYEFAVPGNHEFDYGWSQFENFAKNLKCGFTSCNLRDLRTGELVFAPYKIFTYGDVKIAFVGVCTPESITKSVPSTFMDENGKYIYDFDGDMTGEKLAASIQKAADAAKAEGADYVIVVGHLGEQGRNTYAWTAMNAAEKTRGIDAFIDGHSHEITPAMIVKNLDGGGVPIIQAGSKLNNVGKIVIHKDGVMTLNLIPSIESKDQEITALIADIKARYEGTLRTHLSNTSFDIIAMDDNGNRLIRNSETNLSDLVTDAFLASVRETHFGKADLSIQNGGSIRTNIKAGEITFNDALSVLPTSDTMCIIEVTGQTLLDELEHGARRVPKNSGGFLHSAGMTYTIDARIPSPVKLDERSNMIGIEGERRIKDVKVNGEPLDPAKKYTVVGTSYTLRSGGDGHVFAEQNRLSLTT